MTETPDNRDAGRLRGLMAVGLASWGIYAAIAGLSGRFAITIPSTDRPHLLVCGLFAILFAAYLFAVRIATRITDSRRTVTTIVVWAIAFRIVLLFTTPIQEIDVYRYIWDGNVVAVGVSPYRYSPFDVVQASNWSDILGDEALMAEDSAMPDDLRRLVQLDQTSSGLGETLRTIHFAELTTPYPPVSQAVFALAALTTPDAAAAQTHVIVMKAWIVLFDLLTIAAMIGLLRAAKLPIGWCVAYAWCPLVLKEFANSGHLDAIAVCLTTAAVWQLVSVFRYKRAAALLGLAVGAKLYPIVLLPIMSVWLWTRSGWRSAIVFGLLVSAVSAATLWPMLGAERATLTNTVPASDPLGPPPLPTDLDAELPPPLPVDTSLEETSGPALAEPTAGSGLKAFLSRWRMNDLLFLIVNENLDPSRPESRQPWFAIVPDDVRMAVVSPLMEMFDIDSATAAFLLARGLTLAIFAAISLWLMWRLKTAHQKARHPEDAGLDVCLFAEAAFLTLAWFWLLAPTQNPWYWTWCLPLIPFARSRVWLWVSGLAMAYYLRFWLNAHWPEPSGPSGPAILGSRHAGASFFDFVLVWFEFGPVFGGLFVSWFLGRRRNKQ